MEAQPTDPYGYLLVHFLEDPDGYAERIYMESVGRATIRIVGSP